MKTGIFITARLGSTRLKRKHLLEVEGRPLLHYLLRRIALEFRPELASGEAEVVIATSDEEENRGFELFAAEGAAVHYGACRNIPLRHLQGADARGIDRIVAVDGDDMLCSVRGMRQVFAALREGAPYAATTGLPFGCNSFGYSADCLRAALRSHPEEVLETGWGRIFEGCAKKEIPCDLGCAELPLRFTLDYPEDFAFFSAVIGALGSAVYAASDAEIVGVARDRELYRLNERISAEYWRNFNDMVNREGCANGA